MSTDEVFKLPEGLEKRCLARFDELKEQGRLLYEDIPPESVTHNGFQVL